MNTVNKVLVGLAGCALFLTLAVLGFGVTVQTNPATVNAATGPIRTAPGLQSVIMYESSAGPQAGVSSKSYYWGTTNPQLVNKISGGPSANAFDAATGAEYYDLWFSDADGTPNQDGMYLSIAVTMPTPKYNQDAGGNIDAVGLKFTNGQEVFATVVSSVVVGPGQTGLYSTTEGYKNLALGAPDASGLNGITFLASGGRITLGGFDLPSQNTCTQNASQKCVGNAVYWYDSCNTQGSLVQNCTASQTCSNGACVNNNNPVIVCSSNADCGSVSYGSNVCSGNNVQRSVTTPTCLNPGTSASTCQNVISTQTVNICNNNQTCVNGTCGNTNIIPPVCTSNSYQSCVNGNKYWYDSCGNQQSYVGTCGNVSTCTSNSYQSCVGNYKYWYDSCGNQQSYVGTCNVTNNFGNLTVTVQVRNLSSGNLTWTNSVAANPSDIIQYNVTVKANNNTIINNVTVKDVLPSNLYYYNNLTIDGVANGGNIITGVNIGSLSYGQTKTIMYQVQVAPAGNFAFGTTTLYDAFTASSSDIYNNSGTGNAAVVVSRSGVLGVTDVSTGPLTGNFLVDSFLLPLVLAFAGLWLWKSGVLGNLAIAGWVSAKKADLASVAAQTKLESKIAEIKSKERS